MLEDFGYEFSGARFSGVVKDLLSLTTFDNIALSHESDAMGDLAHESHFVRYDDHGHPFAGQCADRIQNL